MNKNYYKTNSAIKYLALLVLLFLMAGCVSMSTRKPKEYSRTYEADLDRVVFYLENNLNDESIPYTVKSKNKDSISYSIKTPTVIDTSVTFFLKPGSELEVLVFRENTAGTGVSIKALSGKGAFELTRNIFDNIRVKLTEEARLLGKDSTPVAGARKAKPRHLAAPISDVDRTIPVTGISNPHAIAVVIGNRDYVSKDIPAVDYAVKDARTVKEYLIKVFGYKEGNIIYLPNATKANFEAVFGNKDNIKGKLYNYMKKGKSSIFVYYSGHGAPDTNTNTGYFVPVDADPQVISITGYSLSQLQNNVLKISKKMKSPEVLIIVDSCFSGATQAGLIIKGASPITIEIKNPLLKATSAVVMTSSSGGEISSWYPEKGHSMFTYFFLKALKDMAEDKKTSTITAGDVFKHITNETEGLPYYARKIYGRIQTPQLMGNSNRVLIAK